MTSTLVERLAEPEARDPLALASELDLRTQAFVGGELVDSVSGETFPCVSPSSGQVIAEIAVLRRRRTSTALSSTRAPPSSRASGRACRRRRARRC